MDKVEIKFKKTRENAVVPKYAHVGDAGLDMTAAHVEYDFENDCYKYYTGIAFESPKQVLMFAMPRSSNYKTDCYLANGIGLIDTATYRGEIIFCYKPRLPLEIASRTVGMDNFLIELSDISEPNQDLTLSILKSFQSYAKGVKDYYERAEKLEFAPFKVGERIGQMLVLNHPEVELIESELSETERGDKGFGSTGK